MRQARLSKVMQSGQASLPSVVMGMIPLALNFGTSAFSSWMVVGSLSMPASLNSFLL